MSRVQHGGRHGHEQHGANRARRPAVDDPHRRQRASACVRERAMRRDGRGRQSTGAQRLLSRSITAGRQPEGQSAADTPAGMPGCVSANTRIAFATMSANSAMPTMRATALPRRTSSSAKYACRLNAEGRGGARASRLHPAHPACPAFRPRCAHRVGLTPARGSRRCRRQSP